MDTAINDMPGNYFKNRPWGKNNNPKTAISEFLKSNDRFVIDDQIDSKLLLTISPKGFLKVCKVIPVAGPSITYREKNI